LTCIKNVEALNLLV